MEAETCFHQALSIAQNQPAKSLALRAATSLARLWQAQDKHQDATDLLEPMVGHGDVSIDIQADGAWLVLTNQFQNTRDNRIR